MAVSLADLLKAAGEPTRLRILNLLRTGSICVCDLQAVLQIPQPTVSRHLAALRHAGLVRDERDGTRVIYSLAPASSTQMKALYQLLEDSYRSDPALVRDLRLLNEALLRGECAMPGASDLKDRIGT